MMQIPHLTRLLSRSGPARSSAQDVAPRWPQATHLAVVVALVGCQILSGCSTNGLFGRGSVATGGEGGDWPRTCQGLARGDRQDGLGRVGAEPGPSARRSYRYHMAYYATRARKAPVAVASKAQPLYQSAAPGYGLYTFVLIRADFSSLPAVDLERHQELLRVIEHYILAPDSGLASPPPAAHAFLLAVPLVGPDSGFGHRTKDFAAAKILSSAMQVDLAAYLCQRNEGVPARRLLSGTGPFLLTSAEPRLVPLANDGDRLLVDLSQVGVEHLYSILDAYDRVEPGDGPEGKGGVAALAKRLKGLFPLVRGDDWVIILSTADGGGTSSPADLMPDRRV